MENKRGGKRIGSGRKPLAHKKSAITFYVEQPDIWKFGNEEKLKAKMKEFISGYGMTLTLPANAKEGDTLTINSKEGLTVIKPQQPLMSLFQVYKTELEAAGTIEEIQTTIKSAKGESDLSIPDKIKLESYAKELSKEMYTD